MTVGATFSGSLFVTTFPIYMEHQFAWFFCDAQVSCFYVFHCSDDAATERSRTRCENTCSRSHQPSVEHLILPDTSPSHPAAAAAAAAAAASYVSGVRYHFVEVATRG